MCVYIYIYIYHSNSNTEGKSTSFTKFFEFEFSRLTAPFPHSLSSDSEECEVHGCVDGNSVADSIGTVSNELRRCRVALSPDRHGIPGLGRVGGVLGCRESEDVRPLLHRLGVCFRRQYRIGNQRNGDTRAHSLDSEACYQRYRAS